jgi:flagellar FliJ protein
MPPKRFIFKLQSVLDLKLKKEDEEKKELARLFAVQEEENRKLEMLIRKEAMTKEEMKEKQREGGVDVDELKRYLFYLKRLQSDIENQKILLQKIAIQIENQRQVLIKASQERQIYEKLKEKRQDEFNAEIEEEERKLIDELATQKYARTQE